MELKQFGIQVIVIEPGAIITEWNRISRENLIKRSGNTAYKTMAVQQVHMMEKADKWGSQPVVIARVIKRAVDSPHPRTRYAAGGGAKPILFLRSLVPDKLFDRLYLSQLK